MLSHAKNVQICIKYALHEFTYFKIFATFIKWFEGYKAHCDSQKIPFYICEILSSGNDMCFVADIETYCPLAMSGTQFGKAQHILKTKLREVYSK